MEIKNTSIFFVGLVVIFLGVFIIIFDYPQIQFFENMDTESYYLLDEQKKNIHQRLMIEFIIGISITTFGLLLVITSFLKRFKNGFGQ